MQDDEYTFKHYFCGHWMNDQKLRQLRDCEADTALKQMDQARTSGGDADRFLYDRCLFENFADTDHPRNHPKDPLERPLHRKPKVLESRLPSNVSNRQGERLAAPRGKTNAALDMRSGIYCDPRSVYETDSTLGAACNGSEGSIKSQKSVKTVLSRKSSHDLKKNVKSQCKLHEEIGKTLKHMANPADDINKNVDETHCRLGERYTMDFPQDQCKRCNVTLRPSVSKDVMTEIGKCDFMEWRNSDTLTITVDDVVNSKLINPMIRKLQRMSLSLMEDLESLPHQVNDVYKATVFNKQKDRNVSG